MNVLLLCCHLSRGLKSITSIQTGYLRTNEDIRHGIMSLSIEAKSEYVQTAKSQVRQEEEA